MTYHSIDAIHHTNYYTTLHVLTLHYTPQVVNRDAGKFKSADLLSSFCDRILKTGSSEKLSDSEVTSHHITSHHIILAQTSCYRLHFSLLILLLHSPRVRKLPFLPLLPLILSFFTSPLPTTMQPTKPRNLTPVQGNIKHSMPVPFLLVNESFLPQESHHPSSPTQSTLHPYRHTILDGRVPREDRANVLLLNRQRSVR